MIVGIKTFVLGHSLKDCLAGGIDDLQRRGAAISARRVENAELRRHHAGGLYGSSVAIAIGHVDRIDIIDARIPDKREFNGVRR